MENWKCCSRSNCMVLTNEDVWFDLKCLNSLMERSSILCFRLWHIQYTNQHTLGRRREHPTISYVHRINFLTLQILICLTKLATYVIFIVHCKSKMVGTASNENYFSIDEHGKLVYSASPLPIQPLPAFEVPRKEGTFHYIWNSLFQVSAFAGFDSFDQSFTKSSIHSLFQV